MARSILALATVCLVLGAVRVAADPMSYEGRSYGGPLGVGPNFRSSEPSQPKRYRKPSYKPKPRKSAKTRPDRQTETATTAPEKAAPAAKDAVSQNSSISTGSTKSAASAQAPAQETGAKPAVDSGANNVGCKRFIASVGETVSVPCE